MSDDIKMPEPAFRLTWDDSRAGYYVSKPNVGDTDVFTAEQVTQVVLDERARADKWRQAIDDAMVSNHIGVADLSGDPKRLLHNLICWEVDTALDPSVSSGAAALISLGKQVGLRDLTWSVKCDVADAIRAAYDAGFNDAKRATEYRGREVAATRTAELLSLMQSRMVGKKRLPREKVREILLQHGFTIKDGQTDLKPYVYEAVEALEHAHGIVEKESGKCNRCGGEMKPGQALESTLVGKPDDLGGVVTMSPGGQGKLVPCMKCSACGWSVTVGSDK